MKSTNKLLLLTILTLTQSWAACQDNTSPDTSYFEGKVIYEMTYKDLPAEMNDDPRYNTPIKTIMYYAAGKVRTEINMMGGMIQLFDANKMEMKMLTSMTGEKLCINMNKEDLEKAKQGDDVIETNVKVLDETKEIAGYKCVKAIMTTITKSGYEHSIPVFYTKELPPQEGDNSGTGFEELEGFPLEWEMTGGPLPEGAKSVTTALEVEKKTLDKELFEVPDDYEQMTKDEFNNKMKSK